MNTLKEFHGTIFIMLVKNAFIITTYTCIDMRNRFEFIAKRFELSEINRNEHAFLFEGRK